MICTYLRSSSINSWRGCQTEYFLNYMLGLPSKSNLKAAKGNVVHKAMETLAWKSKMTTEGVAEYEDETFGPLVVDEITPEWSLDASYAYYKLIEDVPWNDAKDLPECHEWLQTALAGWNGYFNPMNQIVIEPEVKFDFVIDEPWADYSYDSPWGKIEGKLGFRGTTDLVIQDKWNPEVYECIDYKTGQRIDWATGKEKNYEDLWNDPQLLVYYYALRKKYPGKTIMMNLFFINKGGPYRMAFGDEQYVNALEVLKNISEEIKNSRVPQLVAPDMKRKCSTFCSYGWKGELKDGKTICWRVHQDIKKIGMNATIEKWGDKDAMNKYTGGGRRDVSTEEGNS